MFRSSSEAPVHFDIERLFATIAPVAGRWACAMLSHRMLSSNSDRAFAFAGFLEQISPLQLAWVVCLPVHGNSVERILQGFTGAGINHAGLGEVSHCHPENSTDIP